MDPTSKCVTVTGERGVGKTEMALQACEYVRQRHRFEAILFGDCRAVTPTPIVMPAGGIVTPYLDPCRLVREQTRRRRRPARSQGSARGG